MHQRFNHAQRLLVLGAPPPNFIHTQRHKVVVNAEHQAVEMQLLKPKFQILSILYNPRMALYTMSLVAKDSNLAHASNIPDFWHPVYSNMA